MNSLLKYFRSLAFVLKLNILWFAFFIIVASWNIYRHVLAFNLGIFQLPEDKVILLPLLFRTFMQIAMCVAIFLLLKRSLTGFKLTQFINQAWAVLGIGLSIFPAIVISIYCPEDYGTWKVIAENFMLGSISLGFYLSIARIDIENLFSSSVIR